MKKRGYLMTLLMGALLITWLGGANVEAEEKSYSLGLGVGVTPDYEGSDDYEAVPIPLAQVVWDTGQYVELQGPKLKANLIASETWRLGPMANYRRGRDDVDDKKVDKLEDVDDAFELGLFGGVIVNNWDFALEAAQDVADGHDGFLLKLRGGYAWRLNPFWILSAGVSTTYADDDYMESYFGIDEENAARSGLKTFNADSGIKDVAFDLGVAYNFADNWSLRAIGSYTRLVSDAADSPVTDDRGSENQFFGGVMFIYTFGKAKVTDLEVEPFHF